MLSYLLSRKAPYVKDAPMKTLARQIIKAKNEILAKGKQHMNWTGYKKQVKHTDPVGKKIIEESEAEAAIISALIHRRSELGLSQRDLAALCDIPQSSVARIESSKTTPRLDTLLKILGKLDLTLSVTSSK